MSLQKLSAFSLASFELQAQTGGTVRYADAVYGLEDQISLSPQAMGMVGSYLGGRRDISGSSASQQAFSEYGEA